MKNLGKWAFLIGLLVSILSAFTTNFIPITTVIIILFVLGLSVGLLNVYGKNSVTFLIAVLVLLVLGVGGISALSEIKFLGIYGYLATMLGSFIAFVGATALVMSIKIILDTSQGLDLIQLKKKRK